MAHLRHRWNGRGRGLTAALALGLPLGACTGGVIDPKGPIAGAERLLLIDATGIMLLIVIPVIVMTVAFAWWFRASNSSASYRPDWAYSGRIELIVWLVPLMVVLFLGGVGWISAHTLDPRQPIASKQPPLEIQVVSLDWKWLFIYPGIGVATVNELVIPAGVPVRFRLTSESVMNSFFVPQLGSQIYTMAGMETGLNLVAVHPGRFPGLSAQFSGDKFSDMRFDAIALDPKGFSEWSRRARAVPQTLDAATYAALANNRTDSGVVRYGRIGPHLFDAIVRQQKPIASPPPRPTAPAGTGKN